MADGGYTILHRKDERGVIVESGVFGPDDEIPEGFGAAEYQPVYSPREDDQEPVAESVLTPWESPVAKGTWVGETNEAVEQAAEDVEDPGEESDDSDDELDAGSPVQAREQAGEELTEAEQEAAEDSASSAPPQGGPGSGKEAWQQYAADNNVSVPEGATRDEIIAACEAAGVPVN